MQNKIIATLSTALLVSIIFFITCWQLSPKIIEKIVEKEIIVSHNWEQLENCKQQLEVYKSSDCWDFKCGDKVWYISMFGDIMSWRVVLWAPEDKIKEWIKWAYRLISDEKWNSDYIWPETILPRESLFNSKKDLLKFLLNNE